MVGFRLRASLLRLLPPLAPPGLLLRARFSDSPQTASESDDSIGYPSNRGRKLKRKARFVYEGTLNDAKGPRTYKEVFLLPIRSAHEISSPELTEGQLPLQEIEYFGKRRKIIWRKEKPRKALEDDDEESSEESFDEDNSGEDEADPYADVKLDSTTPSGLRIRPTNSLQKS